MKKQILLTLIFALILCFCGCSSNTEKQPSNESESLNNSEIIDNDSTGTESLPANWNEAYTCVIDGHEGSVYFSNYEILPDELNEGMVTKTVTLTAIYHDVSEDFTLQTVVFPLVDSLEKLDETAWILPGENEELIFEYDNFVYGIMDDEDTYRAEITISYCVPEGFDELAFMLADEESSLSMEQRSKEHLVDENTCWFIMGGLDQQTLTYRDEYLTTQTGNVDVNTMFNYGPGPSDEWKEQEMEEDLAHNQENIPVQLIFMNEHMIDTYNGHTLRFDKIELVSATEEEYIIHATVSYDGLNHGTVIHSLLFDAYNEVHIDEKLWTVDGNTVTFEFFLDPAYAPFTITAGATEDDNYLFKEGLHVDFDFQ